MQILFDPHIGAIRARGEKPVGQKKLCGINVGFKQKKNDKAQAIDNEIDSITYAVDLAKRVKLLLEESRPYGIYHLTNSGQGS